MRILLVSYRFPPDTVGGLERYTEGLAAELVKAGHIVTIVARRTEPGRANIRLLRERLPNGTLLYRVIGPDVRFDRFLENHEQLDRLFTLAVLESKPDIVHINHVMGFSPRILQIAQQFGAAVVLSLHDFFVACPRVHLRKTSGDLCNGPISAGNAASPVSSRVHMTLRCCGESAPFTLSGFWRSLRRSSPIRNMWHLTSEILGPIKKPFT